MKNIIVVGMGKNLINFQTYLVLFTTLKAENISQNKLITITFQKYCCKG